MNKQMKEIFKTVDKDSKMKLDKMDFVKYFKLLAAKMGGNDFVTAGNVTHECMEDIWFEMDKDNTGYVSWHSVKPFIARIVAHEAELEKDRKIY